MFAGGLFSVIPGIIANEFLRPESLVERRLGRRNANGIDDSRISLWNNIDGNNVNYGLVDGTDISYDSNSQKFESGVDYVATNDESGVLTIGASAKVRSVDVNVENSDDVGRIKGLGFGLSTMATRLGKDGSYEAFQFEINTVNFSMSTREQGDLYEGLQSTILFASFEKGHRFALNDKFSLVPQGQLTIGQIRGERFSSYDGIKVKFNGENVYNGRLGLSAEYQNNGFSAYAMTHVQYDQLNVWDVKYDERTFSESTEELSGEFGFGASMRVNSNIDMFLRGSFRESFSGKSDQLGSSNISTGISINW